MMAILQCMCLAGLAGVSAAQTRQYSTGDLSIPYTRDNTALHINPNSSQALPVSCYPSVSADFPSRIRQPQYTAMKPKTSWGPYLNQYPSLLPTQVPPQCNPTAWAWQRLLAAINYTISLDINYCHHHAPAYVTPKRFRVGCETSEPELDSGQCVCSTAGLTTTTNGWKGVDCSNYVAWLYNFAFGYYPTSAIGSQACSSLAPGRLLNTATTANLTLLNPGDLLFITLSSKGHSPPVKVSHVVIWTGWTVDYTPGATGPLSYKALVSNLSPQQRPGTVSCMKALADKGSPVYVISDSHYRGPSLRPFCGWYMTSFSHARRVIDPDVGQYPLRNDDGVAYYDGDSHDCMSMWALKQS